MNRDELEKELIRQNISWRDYNLAGGDRDNSLALDKEKNGSWIVYFSERGERWDIKRFTTESEACMYLLDELLFDKKINKRLLIKIYLLKSQIKNLELSSKNIWKIKCVECVYNWKRSR